MSTEPRVRFAPSPTGYLHVGGLRTALYDYLYARKVGGKFILRIEDTDRNRYVEGAVENLMKSLKAVGLNYDEGPDAGGEFGPYFQSERTEMYKKYAQELLDKDAAYPCFCTAEEQAKMREEQKAKGLDTGYDGRCRHISKEDAAQRVAGGEAHVIRLKIPTEGEVTFYDMVREKVTFGWDTVDDQVLIKTDGFPTYHLANVVDDHHMQITHVIRGEEWLPSTPKHIFMYEQFGWKAPKWVHLPLILNPDRSKLSKRQGDVATEDFLKKGFLPEALINFIALLGWHPSGDRELFSLEELVKAFSLKRITKAGSVFDLEKLRWMNQQYMKSLDVKDIANRSKTYFVEAGLDISDENKYVGIIDFARERAHTLPEMVEVANVFFRYPELDEEKLAFAAEEAPQKVFAYWAEKLAEKAEWSEAELNDLMKATTAETGAKGKNLYWPVRLALFGDFHGPDVPTLIAILGNVESAKRFKDLVK